MSECIEPRVCVSALQHHRPTDRRTLQHHRRRRRRALRCLHSSSTVHCCCREDSGQTTSTTSPGTMLWTETNTDHDAASPLSCLLCISSEVALVSCPDDPVCALEDRLRPKSTFVGTHFDIGSLRLLLCLLRFPLEATLLVCQMVDMLVN